jgi:ATP-dependent Clp protease ATP-binding subunit ClpA/dihydroneopterin aldolase
VFERFTERARRVVVLAQEESGRLRHNHIGTEHLLVGLIREGEGVAAQALHACGVTLDEAREGVEGIVGYGEGDASQKPFTPRSKRVLELALREAQGLRHDHIGTEHLMLGLLAEGGGIAAAVLSGLGVEPADVRREIFGRLGRGTRPDLQDELGTLGWAREALRRSFGRYPRAEDRSTFGKFTGPARKVVVLAQDEARRFNHNYIGTEHMLLGLILEEEGIAARALGVLGVDLDEVREQVESIVGYGEEATGAQAPFTPRVSRMLQQALLEAEQLDHDDVGTEHVLLGLTNETEGVAARVLRNLDVDPDALRREIVKGLPDGEGGFDPLDEARIEEEGRSLMLFRGRVGGIRAEVLSPDEGSPGRRVPVTVGLDYAYHVAREGSDGFETLNHAWLSDLVERSLEARDISLLEAVVGLTGDLVLEEVPSIREVTVTATRETPAPGVTVSATFRR